jgi:hypothetical protein
LKKLIVAATALAVAVLGGAAFGLSAPAAHADPANVWVVNESVATAITGSTFTCNPAGANAVASVLDTLQAASAAQLPGDTTSQTDCVIVGTDGSTSDVTLNARGATVTDTGLTGLVAGSNGTFATAEVTAGTFVSGNTITATQDAVALDSEALTVVGVPQNFDLAVSKDTIQEGNTAAACTSASSTSLPTVGLATATYTDINGNALVGYAVDFNSSSASKLAVAPTATDTAAPITITSMAQTDGSMSAQEKYCGIAAGTANVTATAAATVISGTTASVTRTSSITVTGVPAAIALAAAPASIECNGTNTATVTATVTDSAGNNVVDGTSVTFSVVALGTANPVTTTTTGGTASSVITPLSGTVAGTVVTVSAGSVQQQVTIACTSPVPTVPAVAPTATPKAGTGVTGPNTGTGGYLGSSSSTGFPMWALAALAMASLVLVGGGVVVRRAGK